MSRGSGAVDFWKARRELLSLNWDRFCERTRSIKLEKRDWTTSGMGEGVSRSFQVTDRSSVRRGVSRGKRNRKIESDRDFEREEVSSIRQPSFELLIVAERGRVGD